MGSAATVLTEQDLTKIDKMGARRLSFEDELVPQASVHSLDPEVIDLYRTCSKSDAPTEQLLCEHGFMREQHITNAGILLFAINPAEFIPSARVHLAKFQTFGQSKTKHEVCVKDLLLDGPLPKLIAQVEKSIFDLSGNMTLRDTDGDIKQIYAYPRPAWFDGLLGALMHRSYRSESYVHITISSGSLQILSPGTASNPAEPTQRTSLTGFRNPRLSQGLADMGLSLTHLEKTTTLAEKITTLEEPEFDSSDVLDGQSIRLTLKSNLHAWDELLQENSVDGKLLLSPIYSL